MVQDQQVELAQLVVLGLVRVLVLVREQALEQGLEPQQGCH